MACWRLPSVLFRSPSLLASSRCPLATSPVVLGKRHKKTQRWGASEDDLKAFVLEKTRSVDETARSSNRVQPKPYGSSREPLPQTPSLTLQRGNKIKQAVKEVTEELQPGSVEERQKVSSTLLQRLEELERDGRWSVAEQGTAITDFLSAIEGLGSGKRTMLSPWRVRRLAEKTEAALRKEAFEQLKGKMTPEDANRVAEMLFNEAKGGSSRAEHSPEIQKLYENITKELEKLDKFLELDAGTPGDAPLDDQEMHPILPDQSADPLFSDDSTGIEAALEVPQEASSSSSSYRLELWDKWDRERLEKKRVGLGPRNSFEEMIEWTKEGKMWPYPIDNEYLYGSERDVPFIEHVYLEPRWRQHKVPRSKMVEQFMELVLIGLSKNPYMPLAWKHEHIDWFAAYFKEALEQKRYGLAVDAPVAKRE